MFKDLDLFGPIVENILFALVDHYIVKLKDVTNTSVPDSWYHS